MLFLLLFIEPTKAPISERKVRAVKLNYPVPSNLEDSYYLTVTWLGSIGSVCADPSWDSSDLTVVCRETGAKLFSVVIR